MLLYDMIEGVPKKKLLVICGPTATGKTRLAVQLAKKFNGELISADSRQVYQGMDIGTGKDHPKDIIIHLLDVAAPDEEFSVAQYHAFAVEKIKAIWQQGKLPILVGGTGFYIKAVVDGLGTMGIKPDWELRKKLEMLSLTELQTRLQKLAPEKWQKMNRSDRHNPRRLIRAIEIAKKTQNSKLKAQNHSLNLKSKDILMIGLKAPFKTLYQRIDQRVGARIKQGLVEEIQKLLDAGYSWQNSVLGTTLGYQEFQPFFEKKTDLKTVIQVWQFSEHHYARRQITWFKKDKRIHWYDVSQPDYEKAVVKLVKKWYIEKDGT